jgi:hypothetical protein
MDQVKLWGGLAGVLFVIVVLVLLCRNDIEICKEGSVCCPCCRHQPQPQDERPIMASNQRAENMGHPSFIVPQKHANPSFEPEKPIVSSYPPPVPQFQPKTIYDDNEFGEF